MNDAAVVTWVQDRSVRRHGRMLYRVYVDGAHVGNVARWREERRWTMSAPWLPSRGRDETPADAGRVRDTREAAMRDLVLLACDFDVVPTPARFVTQSKAGITEDLDWRIDR